MQPGPTRLGTGSAPLDTTQWPWQHPVAFVTHLEDRDDTTPIPHPHEHLLHPIALAISLTTPVWLRR